MLRTEIEQALRMARAYAGQEVSWFAPALFAARLVLSEKCPSLAAIDEGIRVYWNPRFVAELITHTPEKDLIAQLAWVWVHEISHVLRDHAGRARDLKAERLLWNVAADCEINDGACWGELKPPQHFAPVTPSDFRLPPHRLAEYYFERLKHQEGFSAQGALGGRSPMGFSNGSTSDEGSGVHGQPCAWELDATGADITDRSTALDNSSSPVTSIEQEMLRRQIAEEIQKHKRRGTIPAGWLRWASDQQVAVVDWRELLRRRVRGAIAVSVGARVDYRFDRPHRRSSVYSPFLRPSLIVEGQPRAACVVDTSGSMSAEELGRALAEVRGVLESLRLPVTVIPCDAVAYGPIEIFTRSDLIHLQTQLRGGGGTNMGAGIEAALTLKPKPDVVIVLTDGFTPYPRRRCRVPVIFGIFDLNWADLPGSTAPWLERDFVTIHRHARRI